VAQRFDGGAQLCLRQTQPLEPMHEVVRQEQQLKKGHIGRPALAGNFVECQLMEQFADGLLDIGAAQIVGPRSPRRQPKITDHEGVAVVPVFEQRQLAGLRGVHRQGATNGDKAVGLAPFLGTVFELGETPAEFQILEAGFFSHLLVHFVTAGHDGITASPLVQIVNQAAGKKAHVGQPPDPGAGDGRGDFGQTAFDEVPGAGVGTGIAGPEGAMPKLLPLTFETEERVIGGPAFGFRVIAEARSLLLAVEGQDDRIQMKLQRASGLGPGKQLAAQLIMQARQLANGPGRQPLEKAAQTRFVWKLFETQQGQKEAIVLQLVGFVDLERVK
jgi:hypothetical protein